MNIIIFEYFLRRSIMEHSTEKAVVGRWTADQHQRFLQGLQMFGKNWKKIQSIVPTRNGAQIRSHAQKYFLKLKKEGKKCLYLDQSSSEVKQKESSTVDGMTEEGPQGKPLHSYYLGKILSFVQNHQFFDLWSQFIDDGKSTVTEFEQNQMSKVERKESFTEIEHPDCHIIEWNITD